MLATLRSYLALKTKSQRQLSLASISGVLGGGDTTRAALPECRAGGHPGRHHKIRLPACCISADTSAITIYFASAAFVLVRLADGSPYACEKRIAARRGVDTA